MRPEGTLLLRRKDVAALLSIDECITSVERVFKLQGEGKTESPRALGFTREMEDFTSKQGCSNWTDRTSLRRPMLTFRRT